MGALARHVPRHAGARRRGGVRVRADRRSVRQRARRRTRHPGCARRKPAHREREPRARSAIRFRRDRQFDRPAREAGRALAADRHRFVQLTVPGTGPREQLAIMDFFVRQHPRIGALVVTADESWCARDPALPMQHPFPFWLYGESKLDFLGRLFSTRALRLAWQRLLVGAGLRQRSARTAIGITRRKGRANSRR